MIYNIRRLLLLLMPVLLSASASAQVPGHTPIMPLTPKQLVAYIPTPGPDWDMTQSMAYNQFTMGMVTTSGVRSFKQKPQPQAPGATPAIPATLEVKMTDAGYHRDFTSYVTAPAPGAPADNSTSYLQINDCPAQLVKLSDNVTMQLRLLVKSRFLLEIKSTNLTDDKLKQFAQAIDVAKLQSVPDEGSTTITDPVIVARYDELNPQNCSAHPVYWNATPH